MSAALNAGTYTDIQGNVLSSPYEPNPLTTFGTLLNTQQNTSMAGADQTALAAQGAANAAALGGQTAANLAQPLPGQAGLQTQASTDISSALQGQLPPDVVT